MSNLLIPLQPIPNQTLNTVLNGQGVTLNVYQKRTGLYMDVFLQGQALVTGVVCLNANKIVRDAYLGFDGDFCFLDLIGDDDPSYSDLGTRFILVYLD